MKSVSDEQLLTKVTSSQADAVGAREALAELVERHQAALTGYLDRLVGADWALAQDLCQETFLRVLRQHHQRGQRPFKPWLYTIATNLARDYFKSAGTRHWAHCDLAGQPELSAGVVDPEEEALAAEQRTEIVDAVRRLTAVHREALLLRFYGDLSLQEIANVLDIPLGTVKSRLSIGLRRLRAMLCADDPVA